MLHQCQQVVMWLGTHLWDFFRAWGHQLLICRSISRSGHYWTSVIPHNLSSSQGQVLSGTVLIQKKLKEMFSELSVHKLRHRLFLIDPGLVLPWWWKGLQVSVSLSPLSQGVSCLGGWVSIWILPHAHDFLEWKPELSCLIPESCCWSQQEWGTLVIVSNSPQEVGRQGIRVGLNYSPWKPLQQQRKTHCCLRSWGDVCLLYSFFVRKYTSD